MLLREQQRCRVDGGDVGAAEPDIEGVDDIDGFFPEAGPASHSSRMTAAFSPRCQACPVAVDLFEQGFRLLVVGLVRAIPSRRRAGDRDDSDRPIGPSPTSFLPLAQVWAFGAEGRVVAVARVDDRRVAVDVEHPARHIGEQLLEVAFLPGLADAAGE